MHNRMRQGFKVLLSLALSMMMLFALAACASEKGDKGTAQGFTFTDDLGRQVTVDDPQRVAAMIGSFADIWCLAGGKDTIVAAAGDAWTQFDLGLDDEVLDLGAIKEPNTEVLIAADPDFIIASANTSSNVEMMDVFESMGVPAAYFSVSSFEDYLRMLDICVQITGDTESYDLYGLNVREQVERAKSMVDGSGPTVLYVRATGSSCKVKSSEGSVLGEMLFDLGCINIADSQNQLLEELSLETIMLEDPQFIFAVLQGSDPTEAQETLERTLLTNPAWQELTAVKEGRFFVLDDELYNLKPNARWGEAYEKLAGILYGE